MRQPKHLYRVKLWDMKHGNQYFGFVVARTKGEAKAKFFKKHQRKIKGVYNWSPIKSLGLYKKPLK